MGDNKKVRKRTSVEGSSTPKKDSSSSSSKAGKGKSATKAAKQARGAAAKSTSSWFGWALSIFWFFVPVLVFALLWWALKPQVDAVMAGYVVPAIHALAQPIFPHLTPAAAVVPK